MTVKKGSILTPQQIQVKQKIMEDLLNSLFKTLRENHLLFDAESVPDLIFSILVLFNREVLVHLIKSFNVENHRKEIIKDLFEITKDEVNKQIKNKLN